MVKKTMKLTNEQKINILNLLDEWHTTIMPLWQFIEKYEEIRGGGS